MVVGSKIDLLPTVENGERKLQQVFSYLTLKFNRWFTFYKKNFVLDCRNRKSSRLDCLRKAISDVKELTIEVFNFYQYVCRTVETVWSLCLLRRVKRSQL